jgi:hypothetical protein
MGIFISVVIIVALIFYASKELLFEKDLPAWTNIALTALILFTVILSIFMLLHKPYDPDAQKKPSAQESAIPQPAEPEPKMSDEEIMLAIAQEYMAAEEQYRLLNPNATDSEKIAKDYIINKYEFTETEWETFLQDAQKNRLFEKAREKR